MNISKPAEEEKTQGSHWESNLGPPALATGALASELWLPTGMHVHVHNQAAHIYDFLK